MKLNRNIKIFINYFFGPLLFIWLSWSIYRQIKHQPDLAVAWQRIRGSLNSSLIGYGTAVILLMIINWSIEAFKWKLSIRSIQQVRFLKAFKAVLSGVSFSVSTPNRVGEYLGRLLYMDEGNRLKTISLTIVGSISQLIITLLMGCAGLIILSPSIAAADVMSSSWIRFIQVCSVAGLLGLTLFYFRLSVIVKWVSRFPGSSKYIYLVGSVGKLSTSLLLKLLLLSGLRFLVFIIQYYLLFRLFDVRLSWGEAYWAVSVSFLVLAVIPSFAIADLGLRGQITLKLIGLFSTNQLGILIATVLIWLVNLILPAIIGSLLILGIKKIFQNKNPAPGNGEVKRS